MSFKIRLVKYLICFHRLKYSNTYGIPCSVSRMTSALVNSDSDDTSLFWGKPYIEAIIFEFRCSDLKAEFSI
jgi:hypothetical protein